MIYLVLKHYGIKLFGRTTDTNLDSSLVGIYATSIPDICTTIYTNLLFIMSNLHVVLTIGEKLTKL